VITKRARVKLADIALKIGSGATPRGGQASYKLSGIPLIRSMNVYDLNFSRDDLAFIDDEQARQLDSVELKTGDVLINITGASVARCCDLPDNLAGGRVNQHVAILRPNPVIADGRYLSRALVSPEYKERLLSIGRAGATREALPKYILENFEIELPPLQLQRRVAGILSAYDDLIEINTRRIAILEEVVRRLFEEWFTRRRSSTSDAPSGTWTKLHLRDLVEDIRDAVLPSEVSPDTAYVGLEHMPRRSTTLLSFGQAAQVASTKLKFRSGDILFGKIRPYFHKVIYASFPGVTSSDSIVIRPLSRSLGFLALSVVSSDEFVAHAVQTSNGTKMPRANWNVLQNYPVALPPETLLAQFVGIVASATELCAKLAAMNVALAAARDLLLPKLISGDIDLSGAERAAERAAAE
jgi:type I restriction enzyme, S subunit